MIRTFSEYLATPPPAGDWAIPGLIPADGWTMIQAPPKTGKTIFAAQLADALTQAVPFLGWAPLRAFKTLYIQVDAPPGDWHMQLTQLGLRAGYTLDRADLGLYVLDDSERMGRLRGMIEATGIELVVWDALEKLTKRDLNEKAGCQHTLYALSQVWKGPSIIVHHPRKWKEGAKWDNLDEAAGNHYLTADASSILTLRKDGKYKGELSVIGRLAESKWRLTRDLRTYAWLTATPDTGPTLP